MELAELESKSVEELQGIAKDLETEQQHSLAISADRANSNTPEVSLSSL